MTRFHTWRSAVWTHTVEIAIECIYTTSDGRERSGLSHSYLPFGHGIKIWIKLILCLLTALLVSRIVEPGLARAASEVWEPVPIRTEEQRKLGLTGGEGFQMVFAITYAPSSPNIVYLSTDTSQVWKSNDGGKSWKSKNDGFIPEGARSLIVDPRNPNIVFAASFQSKRCKKHSDRIKKICGIYRTVNGGEDWAFLKYAEFRRQKSKGCLFAFDSTSSEEHSTLVIFAASLDKGLLRSEDGGNTWRSVAFAGQQILDIEEDPAKPGEFFLATTDGLYSYSKGNARRIGEDLPEWPKSIAVSAGNSWALYVAEGTKGVYKSVDRGVSFQLASDGLSYHIDVTDIAASPVNSNIVYVTADKNRTSSPFYSHDGGKSWRPATSTNLGNMLPPERGFWFSSPIAPHPKRALTALTASNGRGRILKTFDGGDTWSYSGNGFTGGRMRDIAFSRKGKMVFCLTDHGLFLTQDDASTFDELCIPRIFRMKSSLSGAIRNNTIIASIGTWREKGLAVSHDLGKTWKTHKRLIDRFHYIAFHPKEDNVVYAGPYRSLDGGNTWARLSETIRAMFPGDGDIIYAVSKEGRRACNILKSCDRGNNWRKAYPECPFPVEFVTDLCVAPDDPDRLYVATSRGLWIYDGKKWLVRNKNNGLQADFFGTCYVSAVAVDPKKPNVVYAGRKSPGLGQSNGIFRSEDRGLSWRNVSYNLGPELTVWAVEISPLDGTVYIGTSLGTFRLRKQVLSMPLHQRLVPPPH